MNKECENCIKRKTMWCPTSIDCLALDELPYHLDKVSALEKIDNLQQENKQLKKEKDTLYNALIKTRTKYNNDKSKYRRKAKGYRKILTELEEYIKKHIEEWENDEDEYLNGVVAEDKDILQLIQELKEKYK